VNVVAYDESLEVVEHRSQGGSRHYRLREAKPLKWFALLWSGMPAEVTHMHSPNRAREYRVSRRQATLEIRVPLWLGYLWTRWKYRKQVAA
jgi:hypothetical protein